jgi:hypothetical protein
MESRIETVDPVRERLVALAASRRISLAALSGLLDRNASYLQQFVRKGSPRKLEENDRRTLAEFFGVDEAELGGTPRESVFAPGTRAPAAPLGAKPALADWADIPRLPLGASAGPGALADAEVFA